MIIGFRHVAVVEDGTLIASSSAIADFGDLLKRLLVRPARKSASKITPPSVLEKYIEPGPVHVLVIGLSGGLH
ncbi:MAG: hypothetical protein WAW10_10505 [Gallionella sp.]